MKKMLLALILTMLAFYAHCENQLTLSFSKNSSGELILTVTGHTTPVVITIGEVKITLYPEENKVNLSAMGIKELLDVSVEEVETAAGESTPVDSQVPVIPPVSTSINPNPPLTTPF